MDREKAVRYINEQINKFANFNYSMTNTDDFKKWKGDTETVISNIFTNDNDKHLNKFRAIKYHGNLDIDKNVTDYLDKLAFQQASIKVKSLLESFIEEIEKFWENKDTPYENNNVVSPIHLCLKEKVWNLIEDDYGISKKSFGKKINFIKSPYKRKIIFRDIEHSYILSKIGLSKPSIILSGGVIEELLREYLIYRKIPLSNNTFDYYIKTCVSNGIIKKPNSHLMNSARYFRNIVHMENEKMPQDSISKATARGFVSSIFTIIIDF